jgi:hypothetical protein
MNLARRPEAPPLTRARGDASFERLAAGRLVAAGFGWALESPWVPYAPNRHFETPRRVVLHEAARQFGVSDQPARSHPTQGYGCSAICART